MRLLKQSTATTILVGPVLDASGNAVTSAAIGDFNITKNGTTAAMSGNTIAHSHNGQFTIALTTADTDTLNRLTISVNNAAMAMNKENFTVLTANVFDAIVTNGTLAKAGDQMDLINSPNATARQAFATTIEAAILNDADATALLAAIANKVEQFMINDGDAVATLTAIAAAVNSAIVAGQIGTDLTATKASAASASSTASAINTKLGTPAGASVSADIAAVKADTGSISAGSSDWTANERTAIRAILGIPSSGTTPADPSTGILDTIRDQVVANGAALAGAPVEPTGRIASGGGIVAYIGDDFRVRSGTQLQIPVSDPSGGLYTKLNAIGAANLAFGASRPDKAAGAISGTIASLATSGSGASQLLLITVEISNCGSGLRPGDDYTYQIEDRQTQGSEVDSFVRIEGSMELRKKVV